MKPSPIKFLLTTVGLAIVLFVTGTPNAHAQNERIVFAVIGDYGQAGQPLLDVSNLIKSWSPDFIVTVGDNNYPNGQSYSIDDNIGQYFSEFISPYKGKYGSGSTTRRFFPSLGNHDWGSTDAKPYLDYFRVNRYYDFVQGPVHFFVLDSDRKEPDDVSATSEQGKWLRKTMLASTSPFQVVVFHHAPYSSGKHGSSEYMRWSFKEWGADVVLTGHDHVYERLQVNGIPYFVNGIGGAEIYPFNNILPESQVRFNQDFGAMRVEATSQYIKFQMFTRTGILVDEHQIGAGIPSVSSITRQNANPTNASLVIYQVIFTEAVNGVDISDFVLSGSTNGASVTNISGSGTAYSVTVNTGTGDGNLRLDLSDNDSILSSLTVPLGGSGAANGNFSAGESYTVDRTPPVVQAITSTASNPTNAANVDFLVTFSEPVTGVDLGDFSLLTTNGATLSNVSGVGASYTVSVITGSGNDTLKLDFINNGSILDASGNIANQNFTNSVSVQVDRAAPFITAITPLGQVNDSKVEYYVSFSEPVTGVDGSDFFLSTLNGAMLTNVSGADTTYTVSVNLQPGRDSIRLDGLANGSIADSGGNPLTSGFMGGIFNIAIDTPIVTSIIRASPNPTNAAAVNFIVTFSEVVEGVDRTDFQLTNGTVTGVQSLNPFFIVSVTTGTFEGETKLSLFDDDSIHNQQGITLGGNGTGNGNFSGETYTIDRTPPQVTSIVRASPNPAIGASADFIVTFSEPVQGVETNDFILAQSNLVFASVTNVQNANPFYWVTVRTGAGSGTLRLDIFDNGNITDMAGNPLTNNNHTIGESFTIAKTPIDFAAPTLATPPTSVTNYPFITLAWSAVNNAQAYEVILARDANFSQPVLLQTTPQLTLSPSAPLTDGMYFARVRAYSPNLEPGKWSKVISFIVDSTPPSPPSLRSPTQASSTPKRPWLTWAVVSGTVKYQVEVDNNADFSSPEFSANTTRVTLQSRFLRPGNYFWRVRAVDSAGNWSIWSPVNTFRVR